MKTSHIKYYAFLVGIVCMGLQLILMRQFMSVCRGNELSIGILLGVWMLCIAAGTGIGVLLLRHHLISLERFPVFIFLSFYLGMAALVGIKYSRFLFDVGMGEFFTFIELIGLAVVLASPLCLICGALFAFLTKHVGSRKETGEPAGYVYVYESLGACAVGVGVTVAASLTSPLVFMGGVGIVVAVILLFMMNKKLFVICHILLFSLFLIMAPAIQKTINKVYWKSFGNDFKLVETDYTKYGEASIVQWSGDFVYYFNGTRQSVLIDSVAVQQLAALCLCQHPNPQKICIIGDAAGGLATACARLPGTQIDVLQMDEQAFRMVSRYLSSDEKKAWGHQQLNTYFKDSRVYFDNTDSKYDLVLINKGHPATALSNRYFTEQHFEQIKAHLDKDGVLAICGFTAGANYMGPELASLNASLYQTLKSCFTNIKIAPGDVAHYFACSHDSVITSNADVLKQRYKSKRLEFKYAYPEQFYFQFDELRSNSFINRLNTFEPRINTDLQPVAFFYDFLIRHKIETAESIKWETIIYTLVAIVLIFFSIGALTSRTRKIAAGFIAIVASIIGYVAMLFDVVLILGFQSAYGNVYIWIGLLVAAFMLGLSLGSAFVNRRIQRVKRGFLIFIMACLLITALILPILLMQTNPLVYLLTMFGTGTLVGAAFPVLCRRFSELSQHSSLVYSADLTGGTIGAVLVSSLLIPVAGMVFTLYSVAALCVVAMTMIFFIDFKR